MEGLVGADYGVKFRDGTCGHEVVAFVIEVCELYLRDIYE